MFGPGLAYGLTVRHQAFHYPYYYYPPVDQIWDFPETHLARTEFYLTGGIGISYAIGAPRIFINYRYLYGLANIDGEGLITYINGRPYTDIKEYNCGSIISMGFLIPLTQKAWVPAE